MSLLQELMNMSGGKTITETSRLRPDNTYTSPDGKMKVTVDFADPEEREAQIWYDASTDEEVNSIQSSHEDWLDGVFGLYDMSIYDANMTDDAETCDDGGMIQLMSFCPDEDHDEDDDEDDEEEY